MNCFSREFGYFPSNRHLFLQLSPWLFKTCWDHKSLKNTRETHVSLRVYYGVLPVLVVCDYYVWCDANNNKYFLLHFTVWGSKAKICTNLQFLLTRNITLAKMPLCLVVCLSDFTAADMLLLHLSRYVLSNLLQQNLPLPIYLPIFNVFIQSNPFGYPVLIATVLEPLWQ